MSITESCPNQTLFLISCIFSKINGDIVIEMKKKYHAYKIKFSRTNFVIKIKSIYLPLHCRIS